MKQLNRFIFLLSVASFFFCFIPVEAQVKNGTLPQSIKNNFDLSKVETHFQHIGKSDIDNFYAAEETLPLKAGFSIKTDINPHKFGTKVSWSNNEISWISRISVPEVPALGLVLEGVKVPNNAKFYIYSEENPSNFYSVQGKDIVSGYISTPPMQSGSLIIEYVEQQSRKVNEMEGTFTISDIVFIFRGIEDLLETKDLGASDPCHVNINCSPEGDDWQNQKRGLARIIFRVGSSWYLCSGTLVNNAKNPGKPYFLTAEHCGGNASSADRSVWQFFFNYERPSCTNTGTPPSNMITGCTLRALGTLNGGSDFQLVELSSAPSLEWYPYYNGWDLNPDGAVGGVGIHHPKGDAKKISTFTGGLTSANPNIDGSTMAQNSAWRVTWAETTNGHGVTEGGSSGSPIFNSDGFVVGTLSGGSSSCGSLNSPDYYGKFSYHWESNGTTTETKLKPWLDPDNTGVSFLTGYDPNGSIYVNFRADKTFAKIDEQIEFTDLTTGSEIESWSWSFGDGAIPATASEEGPHIVTYNTGGNKTIRLTVNGTETATKEDYIRIQEIPVNAILFEGFEEGAFPPTGWLNIDNDGDSYKWFSYTADATAYSGLKSAGSASWLQGTGALNPDNWLITPPLEITHNDFILEYFVGAQDPEWPNEKYGIFVSTKTTELDDFEQVFVETMQDGDWHQRQISLTQFTGDIIYIAFRHFESIDWFVLKIDDVIVKGGGEEPSHQARIHSFDFQEEGVVSTLISTIENNVATINIEVEEDKDLTNLTPIISISQGATINYESGTATNFSEPVEFIVISESGETVNTYTVYVKHTERYPVIFKIIDSSHNPVEGAIISIENVDENLVVDSEGIAATSLYIGTYTFTINAEDFNEYSGSFVVEEQEVSIDIRLVRTSAQSLQLAKVEVYPNPFNKSLSLRGVGFIQRIIICNLLGEILLNVNTGGQPEIAISADRLARGVYLVILEAENGERFVKRLIKQ